MLTQDIRINGRMRKDLGDIDALIDSIKTVGLLHPIVVKPDGTLIAGARRLVAFETMGMAEIPATIVTNLDDAYKALLAERDENTCRKDFSPEEAVDAGAALEPFERDAAKERQQNHGGTAPGKHSGKIFQSEPERAADKVAAAVGTSRPTLEKAKAVVQAARDDPEQYGDLLKTMNETGKVDPAYQKLKRDQKHKELKTQAWPTKKFQVIYADPPWSYGNSGFEQSAANHYPTMELSEICALPVQDLTTPDSVLYLWVTSPILPDAFKVLDSWGATYKASMVWIKDRAPGMGWFVQTSHEFLLIATWGNNLHPQIKPSSIISGAVTEHSRKPELYQTIEAMYPGPYLELFSRTERANWKGWGNDVKPKSEH